MKIAHLTLLGLLGGCDSGEGDTDIVFFDDTGLPLDQTCPIIGHDSIITAEPEGQDVPIVATATDDSDGDGEVDEDETFVFLVKALFRHETSKVWDDTALAVEGTGDTYEGVIPGDVVNTPGMYYYLWAVDAKYNHCTLPPAGEDDPWHFKVTMKE